jgi:hypothetical protein
MADTNSRMSEIVETIGFEKSPYKAEIVRRADGLLQVYLFRWIDEDVPGYGKVAAFWQRQPAATTITDDIDVARSLARELVAASDPSYAARDS